MINAGQQGKQVDTDRRQEVYDRLMERSLGLSNDHVLACMLASQCVSEGDMPYRLGLSPEEYERMMALHFQGASLPMSFMSAGPLDDNRSDEIDELSSLMLTHALDSDEAKWMATIVTSGCMGGNHLWQDMGLWSRKDLSALMETNFPSLARKNDRDMKWKKFLYKQLCIAEGIYVCRSPSCEVCPDYSDCFAPED